MRPTESSTLVRVRFRAPAGALAPSVYVLELWCIGFYYSRTSAGDCPCGWTAVGNERKSSSRHLTPIVVFLLTILALITG